MSPKQKSPKQKSPKQKIVGKKVKFSATLDKAYETRLTDFHCFQNADENNAFTVQLFGLNETGESASIVAEGFTPFFYVKVGDLWTKTTTLAFFDHLKSKLPAYYREYFTSAKLIEREKLYGFDNSKKYNFVLLEFANETTFNQVKKFWYSSYDTGHTLLKHGYYFHQTRTILYESNIPPILRFYHVLNISPSGWISVPARSEIKGTPESKETTCDREFMVYFAQIRALNDKESRVPYKIMSFDIEASSSHGDFPVPVKSYKKLAINLVDYFQLHSDILLEDMDACLQDLILQAFQTENNCNSKYAHCVDQVYPIKPPTLSWLQETIPKIVCKEIPNVNNASVITIEKMFQQMQAKPKNEDINDDAEDVEDDEDLDVEDDEDLDVEEDINVDENLDEDVDVDNNISLQIKDKVKDNVNPSTANSLTLKHVIAHKTWTRDEKLDKVNALLSSCLPKLEGDKVTFIGSTFKKYGVEEPYLNHCIVSNTCAPLTLENSELQICSGEKDLLLTWQALVQRENPDIVLGYNIFGFDYPFMFKRAEETDCVEDFLKLSKNKHEICGTFNKHTYKYNIAEQTTTLASGTHLLQYIKMTGRVQIDLYNYYRRNTPLDSYKLDYVSGIMISDYISKIEHGITIYTSNMFGLVVGSYIHIEEIGHSSEYYKDGAKFMVTEINKAEKWFVVDQPIAPDFNKTLKWGLAKDDVTPKDLFRMTNGTDEDRSTIAKYCIQDCNLVHFLCQKSDILTGLIEMSKLCSVPLSYLILRGQGIKLTSFIAKICRKKGILIPVQEKGDPYDLLEGAVVLHPKTGMYLDTPVACNDFSSLYPSCIISENICPKSKVSTKTYDLNGQLIDEWWEGKSEGSKENQYDNLPNFEYVDIPYNTFKLVFQGKKRPEKVKTGHKICRYAVSKDGSFEAVLPSILKELLASRKAIRKMIPGEPDEFMKQVLEQRQLSCKLAANSLYGIMGAKTSPFYEKDIASCTTATGRKLLTYAKRIVEECYGNRLCTLANGRIVKTNAEYIYGDTDSVFFTLNLTTPEGVPIVKKEALEITIEIAQEIGHLASQFLKPPHDWEYEKTFTPFCLLAKKRYVGMLYEFNIHKGKRKEMGIVLKRRDNAPIVKDVYGSCIDILMKEQDAGKAMASLKDHLNLLIEGHCPMEKLIISKSLRSDYKNPLAIAHKVLADRIGQRDIGNKPKPGDRIPYVYIVNNNKSKSKSKNSSKNSVKVLQGDCIELPTYVLEHNLPIDYAFYITNQIMKPVQQLFGLILENIWKEQGKQGKLMQYQNQIKALRKTIFNTENGDVLSDGSVSEDKIVQYQKKAEQLRNKAIKAMLFEPYLQVLQNKQQGNQPISTFFKKV